MASAWQEPTGSTVVRPPHLIGSVVFGAGRYGDDRSDRDAHGAVLASLIGAVPSGEVTSPNPPQIPAPPPQAAQIRTPPRPIAAPPPPKQPPPPPKQPPPPAVGPPGGAAGSGASGSNGGGGMVATAVAATAATAVPVRRSRRRRHPCRRALSGSHRETGTEPSACRQSLPLIASRRSDPVRRTSPAAVAHVAVLLQARWSQ